MRIAGVVESETHVCCRYRAAAFRPALEAAGHRLELVALPKSPFARLTLFRKLKSFDAVVLQRRLLSVLELFALRRAATTLLFDIDDAVWLRDSYHRRGLIDPRRERRFARTVRAADLVVCGNDFLAENVRKRGGTAVVIPTCVEPSTYPLAVHKTGPLNLVWVGSSSTLKGLEQVRDTLAAVGHTVPGTRLTLVCDRFTKFDPLPVAEVVWTESTETATIAAADAGVSFIPADDWSRGKCGLKVLQYQAAGLPVIANRVGVHPRMVVPGETGLLADTPAEWVAAVKTLADPALRAKLGAEGRRRVEREYSVAAGGAAWVEVINRLRGAAAA